MCIDQCNDAGEAGQIRLMLLIYNYAEQVAAYLGADDADSDGVVELVTRLAEYGFDDGIYKAKRFC